MGRDATGMPGMAYGIVSGMLEKILPSIPDEVLVNTIRFIAGEMLSWVEDGTKQETSQTPESSPIELQYDFNQEG